MKPRQGSSRPSSSPPVARRRLILPQTRSEALRGLFGIISGSSVAQMLAIASIPLIARLYSPEDAAHYALVVGIGVVVASVAGLKLDLAIPLPNAIDQSRRLFWLATLVPLVSVPGLALVAAVPIALGYQLPANLEPLDIPGIVLFVCLLTTYAAATQLAVRLRAYGPLARIPLLQMAGTLTMQIALGLAGIGRGLFFGAMAGRSLGITRLVRAGEVRGSQIPSRSQSASLLRRYWRFPVIFAPAALVNVLGSNLAAIMLPALVGLGPAGLFAMAVRVAAVPATVLSESAGQVFVGEFARLGTRHGSVRAFVRWSVGLGLLGVAVAMAIWVVAPLLLPTLLGPGWEGTEELAQYAGLMAGAAILGSPLHDVWRVRQRGLMLFSWNVLRLTATGMTIWAGASAGLGIVGIARILAFVTVFVYLIGWVGCLIAAVNPPVGVRKQEWGEKGERVIRLPARPTSGTEA